MSWKDKVENKFIIICGDGKEYYPLWKNPQKAVDYNIAEFEFPNLPGTLVKRGMPMGRKLPLEIYFEGEDHLDTSLAFERSANDIRPWTMEHPYYGRLIVQPTSLAFDNTADNVSKITGVLIETITEDSPKTSVDPVDQIKTEKINLDISYEEALTDPLVPADINSMSATNTKNYNLSIPIIKLPEEFEEYYNLFNAANSAISTATASPLLAMRASIAVISYPAKFSENVKTRVSLLAEQFENLRGNVSGLTRVGAKQIYQNQAGSALSALCLAAATPLTGNYTNSTSVLETIDLLLEKYNLYITDLDSLQSANGGNPLNFIPNAKALIGLNSLMYFTISSLFLIALSAKKERSVITESDTNIILLTHRFYTLDPSDENINELIANNNFGLDHLLQIKKGTKVVYYI